MRDANISVQKSEQAKLEDTLSKNRIHSTKLLESCESVLDRLREDQLEHAAALKMLETRWTDEQEQIRLRKEAEELQRKEAAMARYIEEQEYFSALWIQLRWKAYLKRKSMKQSSAMGKKGPKKGKKKK